MLYCVPWWLFWISFLKLEKTPRFALSQIPLQELRIGLRQIHENEPVERVCEFRIHVESEQLASQFQILAEKDRDGRLLLFDVADQFRQIVDVKTRVWKGGPVRTSQRPFAQRMPISNQTGPVLQECVLLQER